MKSKHSESTKKPTSGASQASGTSRNSENMTSNTGTDAGTANQGKLFVMLDGKNVTPRR